MDKVSFGQILRETRERKGLELNATARRLRIRPDILKAIEEGNFAAMPPRGYTRNMVNGYARYLGLNPTEITGMYLDELYAYQVDYASSRKRPSGIHMPESSDAGYSSRRAGEHSTRSFSRESSATRSRTTRRVRAEADTRQMAPRTHQARGSLLPNSEYTNFYSGPNVDGGLRAKLPYIIAAAIALLLVVLLGWLLFGRGGAKPEESVPNVPVTGVSSETGQSSSTTATAPQPPTKFTFEYSVDNGATSWIEVYRDGETLVSEEVTGPATKSFDCSGVLQFICANPAGVTARQDGTELLLQPDASGIVNMTIDFADVLAKWRKDNNVGSTNAGSTNASSSSAATNAATAAATAQATATQDAQAAQSDANANAEQQDAAPADTGTYDEGATAAAYTEGTDGAGYVETYDTGYVDNGYYQTDQYVDYSNGTGYDNTYYDNSGYNQGYTGYYDENGVWHEG